MEGKVMLAGVLVLGGFLWSYLFLRQFLFNIFVAYPLIKRMRGLQEDLIGIGAVRYTRISDIVVILAGGVLLFLVIRFCPLYLIISFAVGAVGALAFIAFRMRPSNRESFDRFATAYYRFIPDDEQRTLLYNKDYKKIKPRLKAMHIRGTFVPEFK